MQILLLLSYYSQMRQIWIPCVNAAVGEALNVTMIVSIALQSAVSENLPLFNSLKNDIIIC